MAGPLFAVEVLAKLGMVREGRGRKSVIWAKKVEQIVRLAQHESLQGQRIRSCRSMTEHVGVSPSTVLAIWFGRGLNRKLVKTFKLWNYPAMRERRLMSMPEPSRERGRSVPG